MEQEIRELYCRGYFIWEIAKIYNISEAQVVKILKL